MLKTTVLILLTSLSAAASENCFREHITDAMALNRTRRPVYSAMSGGRSERVTDALLAMEDKFLYLTDSFFPFDDWSRRYTQAGMPITCEGLVPMANTPALLAGVREKGFNPKNVAVPPRKSVVARLLTSYTLEGWPEFIQTCRDLLKELSVEPQAHCLSRHFIESMGRIAAQVESQSARAKALVLPDPAWIAKWMIRGHVTQMSLAQDIDEMALPLNAEGIPILCRDVPPISF